MLYISETGRKTEVDKQQYNMNKYIIVTKWQVSENLTIIGLAKGKSTNQLIIEQSSCLEEWISANSFEKCSQMLRASWQKL